MCDDQILLGNKHPDFELTYLGSGYSMDAFHIYRRADGVMVGQVRFYHRRTKFIRFDLPHTVSSPCPFWGGAENDDDERGYVPAWDTLAGFVESLEKYPPSGE